MLHRNAFHTLCLRQKHKGGKTMGIFFIFILCAVELMGAQFAIEAASKRK